MERKFTLEQTEDTGNCEICNFPVKNLFVQKEQVIFNQLDKEVILPGNTIYGHKDCLIAIRR
jgi:hypothetical protein